MKNSKIFIPILSSSSSKESVVQVESRFPNTLSREICADMCYVGFCGTLNKKDDEKENDKRNDGSMARNGQQNINPFVRTICEMSG